MIEWGWVLAAFQFGVLAGLASMYLIMSSRPPKTVLRPYRNPILTHRPFSQVEEEVAEAGAAEMLKLTQEELNSMTAAIMAEAGVDEETARKEVALILAEASSIGQG